MEKDKDIDFDLLQDLMDVDIDPLDIDLEKDPLAAKVFKVSLKRFSFFIVIVPFLLTFIAFYLLSHTPHITGTVVF